MVRVWKDGVSAGNDTTHTAEQEVRKRGADGEGKEKKKVKIAVSLVEDQRQKNEKGEKNGKKDKRCSRAPTSPNGSAATGHPVEEDAFRNRGGSEAVEGDEGIKIRIGS